MGKINSLSYGTVFDTITKRTFDDIKIILPQLPEQQKIASILGALDDKIELNHEMNRTQEEMTSAIFKSWFVDFEPFQDGEFEYNEGLEKEIPKGWEVKSVYSLADYINGMAFKMSDFAEEGLPIIKIAELNNGITDNTKFYNGEYKEKYFLRNDDDTMKPINDKLEPIFKQIFANKLENHSLAQIRESLLPKLLSGEIRVNLSENYNMLKDSSSERACFRRIPVGRAY